MLMYNNVLFTNAMYFRNKMSFKLILNEVLNQIMQSYRPIKTEIRHIWIVLYVYHHKPLRTWIELFHIFGSNVNVNAF